MQKGERREEKPQQSAIIRNEIASVQLTPLIQEDTIRPKLSQSMSKKHREATLEDGR